MVAYLYTYIADQQAYDLWEKIYDWVKNRENYEGSPSQKFCHIWYIQNAVLDCIDLCIYLHTICIMCSIYLECSIRKC